MKIKRTLPSVLKQTENQYQSFKTFKNEPNLVNGYSSVPQGSLQELNTPKQPSHIQIVYSPTKQEASRRRQSNLKGSSNSIKQEFVGNISKNRRRIFTSGRTHQYEKNSNEQSKKKSEQNNIFESEQFDSKEKIVNSLLPKSHKNVSFDDNLYLHSRASHQVNSRPMNISPKTSNNQSSSNKKNQKDNQLEHILTQKINLLQQSVNTLQNQIKHNKTLQRSQIRVSPQVIQTAIPQHPVSQVRTVYHSPSRQPQTMLISVPAPAMTPLSRNIPTQQPVYFQESFQARQSRIRRQQLQRQLQHKYQKLVEQNMKLHAQLANKQIESSRKNSKKYLANNQQYIARDFRHKQIPSVRNQSPLKLQKTCDGIYISDGHHTENLGFLHQYASVSPMQLQSIIQRKKSYDQFLDIADFTKQIQASNESFADSHLYSSRKSSLKKNNYDAFSPLQYQLKNTAPIPSAPRRTPNFYPTFANSNSHSYRHKAISTNQQPTIKIKHSKVPERRASLLSQPILSVSTPIYSRQQSPVRKVAFNYRNQAEPACIRRQITLNNFR